MKRKLIVFTIFTLWLLSLAAQNQRNGNENYWNYHDLINKAEIAFYLNENVDSCLYYYNQAFSTFTFNYVSDLLNAAQIAQFSKKDYKPFVYKGLNYGLKSYHLTQTPLLNEIITEIQDFENTSEYKTIRQNYLSKLDFDYMSWLFDLAIDDQIRKMDPDSIYEIYTLSYMIELAPKIKKNGFPSYKVIGIADSTIFSEIGKPELDFMRRVEKLHDYFWQKERTGNETFSFAFSGQEGEGSKQVELTLATGEAVTITFTDEELPPSPAKYRFSIPGEYITNSLVFNLLHHRGCSFSELYEILLEEIQKGNLHPRELGFLYDRQCESVLVSWRKRTNCPDLLQEDGVFRTSKILSFGKFEEWSVEKVNALRAKYHIVPEEVDKIKETFESKHGFKLFWGYFEWD